MEKSGLGSPPSLEVNEFHDNDDVDSAPHAHHHTLGSGVNQAAPGTVAADVLTLSGAVAVLGVDVTLLDGRVGDVEAAVTALETRPQGVTPSSVVVGSGSASVAADGTVTFTGCSSVSLNGVFDGMGMDCYDLLLEYTTGTTSGAMIRFRKTGTDDSASVYDIARFLSPTSGSAYPATSLAQNSGYLIMTGLPTGTSYSSVRAEIFKPGKAVGTLVTARGLTTLNPMTASTTIGQWMNGILHRPAVAQDGMTIYSSGGTLSGTMKVVKVG